MFSVKSLLYRSVYRVLVAKNFGRKPIHTSFLYQYDYKNVIVLWQKISVR